MICSIMEPNFAITIESPCTLHIENLHKCSGAAKAKDNFTLNCAEYLTLASANTTRTGPGNKFDIKALFTTAYERNILTFSADFLCRREDSFRRLLLVVGVDSAGAAACGPQLVAVDKNNFS